MIKVLIVDDSAFNRVTLTRMFESSDQFRVVGVGVDGKDAIRKVISHEPDVITLDLEMPVMDGFAFLRWLMANRPTPVIVVSSRSSDKSVFKALELGAIDFIAKPGGSISPRLSEIQADLLAKAGSAGSVSLENSGKQREPEEVIRVEEWDSSTPLCVDLIAIGCSTGGPPALQRVLSLLPVIGVPIVVAQHMPAFFTRIFAERLDRRTHFTVVEAEHEQRLEPGRVYICPGGQQTTVQRSGEDLVISVRDRHSNELYAPSVDLLFESCSFAVAERLAAVVMTGMGDDGARGMQTVRSRGGKTIAEAPSTAIIFGMPGAAIRRGAVEQIRPLPEIARSILDACADE